MWQGAALLLLLCMLVCFLLVWLVILFVEFVARALHLQVLATGVRVWLLQGGGRGLLLLCVLTAAWSGVLAHLQALLRLLMVVVLLHGARALGCPFHGTWGRFSLCCAGLESLAASHVLAEHLSSRIDLIQTVTTSKAGLVVHTY